MYLYIIAKTGDRYLIDISNIEEGVSPQSSGVRRENCLWIRSPKQF
ncbi:MAG: hypothetical protein SWX82_05010 [Cyanobacteriota bacterium]|nr:hypothetical protein [Cyanobacteriota bacterium]